MPKSLAFFKGNIVPLSQAKVSVMTHALHYGTAVFEGVRGNWNSKQNKMIIFRLNEHYERLLRGCKILLMDIPYSAADLCKLTIKLVQESGYQEDVYIRPIAYKSAEQVANLKLHTLESDFAKTNVCDEYTQPAGPENRQSGVNYALLLTPICAENH